MGRRVVVIVLATLFVASCTSSQSSQPEAPVVQEEGGAVAGITDTPLTFIAEGLVTGVLSGVGSHGFSWVLSLAGAGDKTPEQLQQINSSIDRLDGDITALKAEVDGLRQEIKTAFTEMSAKVDEAALVNARSAIDTANLDLKTFNDEARNGRLSQDFVKAYGVTAANPLSKSLIEIDNVLRTGGAAGQPLITTAHQLFASKPQASFDDRELRARLGLPRGADQKAVTDACAQPAKAAICKASTYYDLMAGVLNYYIAYQVRALQVLVVGLYANGTEAGRALASSMVTLVWNNIREQVLLGGAPISDDTSVLENAGAPQYGSANLLWQRQPTTAVSLTRPEPVPFADNAPMDCSPQTSSPQCRLKDTPFHVETSPASIGVPSAPLCLLEGKRDTSVFYAAFKSQNGITEATAADLVGCQGSTTGLRVPMRAEFATATAKNPQDYDALRLRPAAPPAPEERFLTYTPALVACGYKTDGSTPSYHQNVNFISTINGLADTWTKGGWARTPQFSWYNWRTHAQQGPDSPCIDYEVPFHNDTDAILATGFNQCMIYSVFYHDQCEGRGNYVGKSLGADTNTSVWAVRSVVRCEGDKEDVQGRKPGPHETNSCVGAGPAPGRWEVPFCATPSGRWTICGDTWINGLWAPIASIVPPSDAADCATWTANGTVCSAGDGDSATIEVIDDSTDHSVRVESSIDGVVTLSVASSAAMPCLTAGQCADSVGATIQTFQISAPPGTDPQPLTLSAIVAGTAGSPAPAATDGTPDTTGVTTATDATDSTSTTATTAPAVPTVTIDGLSTTTCTAIENGLCVWQTDPTEPR